MLIGLEASRRNPGRLRRRTRRLPVFPGQERVEAVDGDRGTQQTPVFLGCPNDSGAPRREDPLVRPGGEEIAAERVEVFVLSAQAMNAVQHEEHAVALAAVAIHVGYRLRQGANR